MLNLLPVAPPSDGYVRTTRPRALLLGVLVVVAPDLKLNKSQRRARLIGLRVLQEQALDDQNLARFSGRRQRLVIDSKVNVQC